jgi:hypothetical protein
VEGMALSKDANRLVLEGMRSDYFTSQISIAVSLIVGLPLDTDYHSNLLSYHSFNIRYQAFNIRYQYRREMVNGDANTLLNTC